MKTRRRNHIAISNRTNDLVEFAGLMTYAEIGRKVTKAETVERLIDLGAQILSREQKWQIPDSLIRQVDDYD